ncbi:phosphoglycerate dehydrogenase, partial [Candidatus Roizmanbacteria bacterium]|nr:phosphoglycerate dehydrogenase [Candidatus Roizmanbacteria bacterium]
MHFIIDFDSTIVTLESLDKLAEIVLKKNPDRDQIVKKIQDITVKGMNGEITFDDSLQQRLNLFKPARKDINSLVNVLKKHITPSFARNIDFFKKHRDEVYVISGGFKEYLVPVLTRFGVREDHILANTFTFDSTDVAIGFDHTNYLAQSNGKVKQIRALKLSGDVFVIGDGYTDYEIKKAGLATKFFSFTENISREKVNTVADEVVPNFDEVLYRLHEKGAFSYPKNRINVLLLENISSRAVDRLKAEGYQVKSMKSALSEEELIKEIKNVSILGIRSKTKITENVLKHAKRLQCVGAFCIGVNQIDLDACASRGVAVFNAPFSNTRSVVELAVGDIIMLMRKAFDKSIKLHQGEWDKDAQGCHEVRGKKLGIIGYGNIGSQLSVLAEMLGLAVYFYNTSEKLAMGNAIKCNSLEELLKTVDVVTLHVDGQERNRDLIGEKEFKLMKDGALFLNLSRGFVVDVPALANYIKMGKIRGAAIDVFPSEPKSNGEKFVSELQGLPNLILTPQGWGRTIEAQNNIGEFVTERMISFINTGNTTLSVNFPQIQLSEVGRCHRILHVHQNLPGVMAKINNLLFSNGINIEGQYLKTEGNIG